MSNCLDCWRDIASKFLWYEEQSVKYHTEEFWPLQLLANKQSLPGKTGGEIMRWRMDDVIGADYCRLQILTQVQGSWDRNCRSFVVPVPFQYFQLRFSLWSSRESVVSLRLSLW